MSNIEYYDIQYTADRANTKHVFLHDFTLSNNLNTTRPFSQCDIL